MELNEIFYGGDEKDWSSIEFEDANGITDKITIYYSHPRGHVSNDEPATYDNPKVCDICGKIIESGHTEVTGAAIPATCTTDGLTEGNHCTVCNKVTVKQELVPALGHDFSTDWTIDKEATETEEGSKSRHCARCDEKIDVTAIPKAVDSSKVFMDVSGGAWFKSAVDYVASYGLMNGVSDTEFAPNETMNRAMLVTVLYRIEGEPAVNGNNPFTDIKHDWYKNAPSWACSRRTCFGK